jgi:ABC-type antimicrobial peptide transport system permease subunit
MTASSILLRSVRYYWRTHLGVILGAALGAIVLTGALLVGDSVKATLREQALARVGKINGALLGGDRFFRSALAPEAGADVAPVLLVRGSAARADGKSRVNQAQVVGVDDRFWKMSIGGKVPVALAKDEIALNQRLAAQLGVAAGETIIIRVEKPSAFSRDAPLSGDENEVIAIRAKVVSIVDDTQFGRFALQASQVPPFTAFIALESLQQRIEQAGKANLLLSSAMSSDQLRTALGSKWQLEDSALELREVPTKEREIRTTRVFLDPVVATAAPRGVDSLTYLVNELRSGEKATPYSMVTALDAPSSGFLPAELADDEIAISEWLAEDLGVREGAKIAMKYFVMGERRQLEERSREFTVLAVIPQSEPHLNPSWMPQFPGLADKANCRDWEPGFAMDMSKIRDNDEAYWDKYQGTPKAFVNIMVGQEMWRNRWGELTSIRYPANTPADQVANDLRAKLKPESLGMSFVNLQAQAAAATDAPVDFGQLFVAFSFFLLIAAAVLTGLLFVFSLQQRNEEAGLLLALGWQARQVRRLFLAEGLLLSLIGSTLGAIGGLLYTKAVLQALTTVWRGAVGSVSFTFAPSAGSFIAGILGSVGIAMLAMWLASRRQLRHSARELLTASIGEEMSSGTKKRHSWTMPIAIVCLLGALILVLFARNVSPEIFFGAGSLLLIAGLAWTLRQLQTASRKKSNLRSIAQLGHRSASRRRGRSLATIAVLASGVFMVVAVSAFRKSADNDWTNRKSGTGGFGLVAESSLPIYEDLNSPQGREAFGLDEKIMAGASVVPFRVREGDDASCLNLNRALQPRLLGVKAEELRSRDAFRFAGVKLDAIRGSLMEKGDGRQLGWGILEAQMVGDDDAIPGVVDQNTLMWALQMKLGSVIEYPDGRGKTLKVRLVGTVAGSMLQGNVIIAERHFIERFPNLGGYRYFLIDTPKERLDEVAQHLSRQLQDRGFEVTVASRRLADFLAVENTYLSIFQALGGLGLLLGSAGLAIVVARNVLERRREFGLLEAVGFRPVQLRSLVFAEHRWLIGCGLVIGTVSALVAVWPQLSERAAGFPYREMSLLLIGLVLGALFWTWLATRLSLRGRQITALQQE